MTVIWSIKSKLPLQLASALSKHVAQLVCPKQLDDGRLCLYCGSFPKVCACLPRRNLMFSWWNHEGFTERSLINIQTAILLYQRSSITAVGESEPCKDTILCYSMKSFIYLKASFVFHKAMWAIPTDSWFLCQYHRQAEELTHWCVCNNASDCFHFNFFLRKLYHPMPIRTAVWHCYELKQKWKEYSWINPLINSWSGKFGGRIQRRVIYH